MRSKEETADRHLSSWLTPALPAAASWKIQDGDLSPCAMRATRAN